MINILTALGPYRKSASLRNAQRLKAFVLLLRYLGMRIGDAFQPGINRLQGNKLPLHTEKTGVHVYCVLPNIVTRAIDAAPPSSPNHSQETNRQSVAMVWTQTHPCSVWKVGWEAARKTARLDWRFHDLVTRLFLGWPSPKPRIRRSWLSQGTYLDR